MRDFSPSTLRNLSRKGITVRGPVALPDYSSAMPFANADRGYAVNDRGCLRIWTHAQVVEASLYDDRDAAIAKVEGLIRAFHGAVS
jgi:hypothetical protein